MSVPAASLRRILFTALFVAPSLLIGGPAWAATTLSAEIVSWQGIGLDSNAEATSEPELFMVQAQITNTGGEAATDVQATLTLVPPDCGGVPCVTLASSPTYTISSIAPGAKADAFWTVRIAKTSLADNTITPITVTVTAANAPTITATQAPRTGLCTPDTPGNILLVEELLSQSRNFVRSYTVSPGTQLPDGSWEVVRGSTFTVTVLAHTATDYQEISVPAIVDPSGTITPREVSFTYENGTVDDDIYTVDAGGEVTAVYTYSATNLGNVELSQLIYDCSGGSWHYNSDYGLNSLTILIVDVPLVTLSKSASPNPASPGETITITITYTNSGGSAATNFMISDTVDPILENIVAGSGGVFDPATRTITWNIGTVAASTSGSVSFTATVSDFAGGRTLTNVATGTADQFGPIESPPLRVPVRPTTPVTGAPSLLLAILGWSSIGFGVSLASRRLERLRF